ncbi:hypothetical protein HDU76_004347 [Blyttiomyces sp. JEL0837]|nr:hypothetical protein HDU76_004347 [Blyttiomyces sp. JEL0837]
MSWTGFNSQTPWRNRSIFNQDILDAPCLGEATKAIAIGGGAGAFLGGAKGWWLALPGSQTGALALKTSGLMAGISAVYYLTMCNVAQFRHKDDSWNATAGGFVSGWLLGMRAGTLPRMLTYSIGAAAVMFVAEATSREIAAVSPLKFEDRVARRSEGYFAWPARDPYAERWKAIQEREAEQ